MKIKPIAADIYADEPDRQLPRRDRVAVQASDRPMQRWSLDFMSDQLADHRRFRVLNVVDDHCRLCPGQIVDVSITGTRVARFLDELALEFGLPEEIVLDNGPEGTSRAMFDGRSVPASGCDSSNHASPSRTPTSSPSTASSGTSASTCTVSGLSRTPAKRSGAGGTTTTPRASTRRSDTCHPSSS
jgi:hypothetical protein